MVGWRATQRITALLAVVGLASAVAVAPAASAARKGAPVVALDLRSGKLRWRADLGVPAVGTTPATGDGRVYVTGETSCDEQKPTLVAFDAGTGREDWRVTLPPFLGTGGPSALVAGHGRVVFARNASDRTTLEARDAATGARRWRHSIDGPNLLVAPSGDDVVATSVGADGTEVVAAYARSDGRQRWRISVAATNPPVPSATTSHAVYVPAPAGFLTALDARTGRPQWRVPLERFLVGASGSLVLTWNASMLIALDPANGAERWRGGPGAFDNADAAVAADGTVFTVAGVEMRALDAATGATRWSVSTTNLSGIQAVFSGRGAAGLQGLDDIVMLDARTGRRMWTAPGGLSGGGPRKSSAVIGRARVYQVRSPIQCDWGD